MRGFKLQITLKKNFRKEIENNETKYSSKIISIAQKVINNLDINDSLENSYQTIL